MPSNCYPLLLTCQKTFNKVYRTICSVVCIMVIFIQACFLNFFLVNYLGLNWLSWTVADVFILLVFVSAFFISHRELKSSKSSKKVSIYGELPMGYLAWLTYSVIVSIKIGIIYGPDLEIVANMNSNTTVGPNIVKSTVAISSLVFLFLVLTHHDAGSNTYRSEYINNITRQVTIDILDTTQFLDIMFISESKIMLGFNIQICIIVIACLNIVLPTLLLLGLSYSGFGKATATTRFSLLHKFFYHLIINFPMLVMRSFISHKHNEVISIFLIKNVLAVAFALKGLLEHCLIKFEDKKESVSQNDN